MLVFGCIHERAFTMSFHLPRRQVLVGLAAGICAPSIVKILDMPINSLRNRLSLAYQFKGTDFDGDYYLSALNFKILCSPSDYAAWVIIMTALNIPCSGLKLSMTISASVPVVPVS